MPRPEISPNKPHARSAYAHLPLKPLTFAQLVAVTPEDRAYYEDRPITVTPYPSERLSAYRHTSAHSNPEKARLSWPKYNLVDESEVATEGAR